MRFLILLVVFYIALGLLVSFCFRFFWFLRRFRKSYVKRIFLTFDDGIDPLYTPMVLDVLKRYRVKASFFVVASFAELYPDVLRRIVDEGHCVCFHSYDHRNQIFQGPFAIWKDFSKSMKVFEKLDVKINYYRPPWGLFGFFGFVFCKVFGMKALFWDVIVGDWSNKVSYEELCERLKVNVKGDCVVCLHDGRGDEGAPLKTVNAIDVMIGRWLDEGFKFEKVDEVF